MTTPTTIPTLNTIFFSVEFAFAVPVLNVVSGVVCVSGGVVLWLIGVSDVAEPVAQSLASVALQQFGVEQSVVLQTSAVVSVMLTVAFAVAVFCIVASVVAVLPDIGVVAVVIGVVASDVVCVVVLSING